VVAAAFAFAGCFDPDCLPRFAAACFGFALATGVTLAASRFLAVAVLPALVMAVLEEGFDPDFDSDLANLGALLEPSFEELAGAFSGAFSGAFLDLAVFSFCGAAGDCAGSMVSIAGAGAANSASANSAAATLRNMELSHRNPSPGCEPRRRRYRENT
jgi:hypothetical protein